MQITLYKNFSKKNNSTKRPDANTDRDVFDCVLKDNTSVTDPVVVLDLSDKANFTKYTYAWIPAFQRNYFVVDMVADGMLWDVVLTCDVLATYRTDIGNSTMYVLRSAAAYDGDLIDDYYPVGVTHTNNRTTADNPLTAHGTSGFVDINGGCFILGIVGATGSLTTNAIYGSVTYYAFNRASMDYVVKMLLDNNLLLNSGYRDNSNDVISIELQKSIVDPLQFIKSCIWIPIAYSDITGTAVGQLYAFGMEITFPTSSGLSAKQVSSNPPQRTFSTLIDIPKHPLAASRGVYMNCEPFSRYQLFYPPFGLFDLDTTAMCSGTSFSIVVYLDLITGSATLRAAGEGDGKYLVNAKSQVGVPINLSQITYDYLGAAGGVAGGLIGMIGSAISGNLAGASMSAVGLVGSAVNAMRPAVSSMGGNGGFADITGRITLLAQFYHMPDEDLSHAGRPLCENRQLSTLPGYQKIMDGDVSIAGTAGEQAAIKAFLEGGYFYE